MAKAVEAEADIVGSPRGHAQQPQQAMQPDEASTETGSQPASGFTAMLHVLFEGEKTELQFVSGIIQNLVSMQHHLRVWEEMDSLYQQLATRLYFGRRCEESSAILECLTEEIPVDACNVSSNKQIFQKIVEEMKVWAEVGKAKVKTWRAVMSAGTSEPSPPAAVAELRHSMADESIPATMRANLDYRQMMLGILSKSAGVSRRAKAIIGCLDAQARQALVFHWKQSLHPDRAASMPHV